MTMQPTEPSESRQKAGEGKFLLKTRTKNPGKLQCFFNVLNLCCGTHFKCLLSVLHISLPNTETTDKTPSSSTCDHGNFLNKQVAPLPPSKAAARQIQHSHKQKKVVFCLFSVFLFFHMRCEILRRDAVRTVLSEAPTSV